MKAEGIVLDSRVEIPENMRFYMIFFTDASSFADAMYGIGESEIGYCAVRIAMGAYIALMMPHSGQNMLKTRALKSILTETLKYSLTFVLAGDSEGEIAFQERVLKRIASDYGGFLLELNKMGPMSDFMPLNFLRVSIITLAFGPGGIFVTCLDGNEALDSQMVWVEITTEMKQE
ncbi:MAG: hypothetical protein SWK76_03955 [Actinomycetota bacterium]|nr:hypothetical protein [Actinomycetota bacterium]